MNTYRPTEVGDKFEDLDPRAGERVIEIIAADPYADTYRYVVRAYVRMPWLVANPKRKQRGREISGRTLRNRYRRISR